MALIIENGPHTIRKHELIRLLDREQDVNKRTAMEAELEILETKIRENYMQHLKEHQSQIRDERPNMKGMSKNKVKQVFGDYFLELIKDLDDNMKKGIGRYMYKKFKGKGGEDDD